MMNANESLSKAFYSSEYSTTSARPRVVMTYDTSVSINYSEVSLAEGETKTLTAVTKPMGQTVTWATSNSAIATVSASGVVTAVKAGTATITATLVDTDGDVHTAYCTVYVYIPNGVYRIRNYQTRYYLHVENGGITNRSNVYQYPKNDEEMDIIHQLRQMWKTYYLGSGRYSIRPMHKLNMGLDVTNGNVDIWNIGETDTLASVPSYAEWTIEWDSSGYVFKNNGSNSLAILVENASTTIGANVVADSYSSADTHNRWTLEIVASPPTGTMLYDTVTGAPAITYLPEYVAPNETRSLTTLGLVPIFYSDTGIGQTFYWYTTSSTVTVNSATGAITGVSPGVATVIGYKIHDGMEYEVIYNVVVTDVANGTYFLKNKQTGYYADIEAWMDSGINICQWEFHGEDSQKWIFTHLADGYYSIKSKNSSAAYYMGVINDSTALDVDIVLRTGTLTDGMKWKIEKTVNGAYKIIPKTGELSGYILATSTSSPINAERLIQGDYIDNDSYRDEWYIGDKQMFVATVNMYYDKGYYVYYNETEDVSKAKLDSYLEDVSKRYYELLGLLIEPNNATYYNSRIDLCKGTVSLSNIDHECTSTSGTHLRCTILFNNIHNYFKSSYPGNETTTSAYWTGHLVRTESGSSEVNRSCSVGEQIYMLERSESGERDKNSKGILMHELNHQYGAPDHYHEDIGYGCRNADVCSECGENPRPESCIMNESRQSIRLADILCEGCRSDIMAHLESHH